MYELPDDRLDWYAIWTAPQREARAKRDLERMDIRVEMPTEKRLRRASRKARRKEPYDAPVLPRYLFAGFHGTPPWLDILRIPTVYEVLGVDGSPSPVDYRAMVRLIEMVKAKDETLADRELFPNGAFSRGDLVRVLNGPFAGQVGTAVEFKGRAGRLDVTVFGRVTPVWAPLDDLAPAA